MSEIVFVAVLSLCSLPHVQDGQSPSLGEGPQEEAKRGEGQVEALPLWYVNQAVSRFWSSAIGAAICPQHLTQKRSFSSMSSIVIQQATTTPFSKWVPVSGPGGCWSGESDASQENQKGEGTVSRAEGEQFAKKHELHVWHWANEPPFSSWHMAYVCFDVPLSSAKHDSFAGCVQDKTRGLEKAPFPKIACRWKRYRSLDKTLFFRKRTCDGLSFIQNFWCLDGSLLFW